MFQLEIDQELTMRVLEPCHAEELFRLTDQNREHLRPWLPWVDKTLTVEDSALFIQMTLNQYDNNEGFTAGIFHKDQLCGVIGLHPPNWHARHASIGYWLDFAHQGKGIMTRACQRLIQFAFTELGLNRVEIRAVVLNKASRAIPERLGFVLEGVMRQIDMIHGQFVDMAVYSLLLSEWQKGQDGE